MVAVVCFDVLAVLWWARVLSGYGCILCCVGSLRVAWTAGLGKLLAVNVAVVMFACGPLPYDAYEILVNHVGMA